MVKVFSAEAFKVESGVIGVDMYVLSARRGGYGCVV